MSFGRLDVALGAPAPNRDEAIDTLLFFEAADIVAELFDHLRLVRRLLHVRCLQSLYVLGIERSAHRPNRLELGSDGREMSLFEHRRMSRGLERILRKYVPASENEVVERRERDEILD